MKSKTFTPTLGKHYKFYSCQGCGALCCKGSEGTVYSQLLLSDFETVAKYFPILFSFGDMGFLKANILYSDGHNYCPYIQNFQCVIYDERPSICRVYPLSPHIDNQIYIDENCPALNQNFGHEMVKNGVVDALYDYPTLQNYQDKMIKTHLHLHQFNDKNDFKKVLRVANEDFYQYVGKSEDSYMQLHRDSLQNLQKIGLEGG